MFTVFLSANADCISIFREVFPLNCLNYIFVAFIAQPRLCKSGLLFWSNTLLSLIFFWGNANTSYLLYSLFIVYINLYRFKWASISARRFFRRFLLPFGLLKPPAFRQIYLFPSLSFFPFFTWSALLGAQLLSCYLCVNETNTTLCLKRPSLFEREIYVFSNSANFLECTSTSRDSGLSR